MLGSKDSNTPVCPAQPPIRIGKNKKNYHIRLKYLRILICFISNTKFEIIRFQNIYGVYNELSNDHLEKLKTLKMQIVMHRCNTF